MEIYLLYSIVCKSRLLLHKGGRQKASKRLRCAECVYSL